MHIAILFTSPVFTLNKLGHRPIALQHHILKRHTGNLLHGGIPGLVNQKNSQQNFKCIIPLI